MSTFETDQYLLITTSTISIITRKALQECRPLPRQLIPMGCCYGYQNLIICSSAHFQLFLKISSKSVHEAAHSHLLLLWLPKSNHFSLVHFQLSLKFQANPFMTFCAKLLTNKQTNILVAMVTKI